MDLFPSWNAFADLHLLLCAGPLALPQTGLNGEERVL